MNDTPAYGLWSLVVLNLAIFIIFAFSFAKPQSTRDWRSFGAFPAFLVALFTEMYGFPPTYLFLRLADEQNSRASIGSLTTPATCSKCSSAGNRIRTSGLSIFSAHCSSSAASWYCSPRPGRCSTPAQREHRLADEAAYMRGSGIPSIRRLRPHHVRLPAARWPTLVTLAMFPLLVCARVLAAGLREGARGGGDRRRGVRPLSRRDAWALVPRGRSEHRPAGVAVPERQEEEGETEGGQGEERGGASRKGARPPREERERGAEGEGERSQEEKEERGREREGREGRRGKSIGQQRSRNRHPAPPLACRHLHLAGHVPAGRRHPYR